MRHRFSLCVFGVAVAETCYTSVLTAQPRPYLTSCVESRETAGQGKISSLYEILLHVLNSSTEDGRILSILLKNSGIREMREKYGLKQESEENQIILDGVTCILVGFQQHHR